DLVEKPAAEAAPSDLAIIGRYVLTPDVFPILAETPPDHRGEIQITDALRRLRERRPLYAVRFTGRRYDTGEKLGFLKATVGMALARPALARASRALPNGAAQFSEGFSEGSRMTVAGRAKLAGVGGPLLQFPYLSPLSTASIP